MKVKSDHRSKFFNFSDWKAEAAVVVVDQSSLSPITAVQIWISHIFHIISLHGKIWTQQIDLAHKVRLHSSVGWASHRYRGGHGFESHWYFQASPFQLLKWENLLRWLLFTFNIRCEKETSLYGKIRRIKLPHSSNTHLSLKVNLVKSPP